MRKLFIVLAIILLPVAVFGFGLLQQMGSVPAGGDDCPDWGTYVFAWDGGHSSGQLYACTDSGGGSTIQATNNGPGTLSGSGADTVFTRNNQHDSLRWSVSASEIDHDAAAGVTVWVEASFTNTSDNRYSWGFIGDTNDLATLRVQSDDDLQVYFSHDGTMNDVATTDNISEGSFITLGSSWKVSEAGNDLAVTIGNTWASGTVEEDDDVGVWDAGELTFCIGECTAYNDSSDFDLAIKKIVVIESFKAACPW